MSTLSWNFRGLGNPRTVHEVVDLVSKKKPDFVFLMETMIEQHQAERIKIRIGFEGHFCVSRRGHGGGLLFLWRKRDTVSLISYSQNHIDVMVAMPDMQPWRLTGWYGFPEHSRRREAWDYLRLLHGKSTLPWLVIGDFNDIARQSEKRGLNPHPDQLLQGFVGALQKCDLLDLGMLGYPFTWERGGGTESWVEERLDRAVASPEWRHMFEKAVINNLAVVHSDHSAIFCDIHGTVLEAGCDRQFRFENAWISEEGCKQVVLQAWHEGSYTTLQDILNICALRLMEWGGEKFHNFGKQIGKAKKRLANLKGRRDSPAVAEYNATHTNLRRLLNQEEAYWKQRAKQFWLKEGDRNTKFFHRYASNQKKKNQIRNLKDPTGEWVEGDAMKEVITNYFTHIFRSNDLHEVGFFNDIQPKVSMEHNIALLKPFQSEEVKAAIFSMYLDKAPGPDGMNPGFYQHFWGDIGEDVTNFVLNCLHSTSFPPNLNDATIVLIPKKTKPETPADLRPIALCNVLYKIMGKMIANRMKDVLKDIISESQSAFVPGRLITDNILIAAETGHYLRRK